MKFIDFFRQYRKNKNAKVLMTNFLSLSTLQIISYFFPIITMPYLARVIGVDGFGALAFGSAVIAYFSTITDWGFRYTAVRDVSVHRNDINYISELFGRVMVSKVLLMIACAIVLYMLIEIFPLFKAHQLVLWATFVMIPGYMVFPEWLFQAMEEMKYITIVNLVAKTIFTILIFCLIKKPEDFVIQPILQGLGFAVSGGIAFWYAFKHFKLKFIMPSFRSCLLMMRSSWNMFVTQLLPTLYNNLSVIVLENVGGTRANGIFSAGNKYITITDQVSQALSRAFYPFLARRMDKHSFYVRLTFGISLTMSVVIFLTADLFIKIFFTPEFNSAVNVIRIMSISPFFLTLMNSFGTNGLALIGKDNVLRNIVTVCSVVGLIFVVLGVYLGSYKGVAVALTTTWGIRGLMSYLAYNHYKNN